MNVVSVQGKGTEFEIDLPIHQEEDVEGGDGDAEIIDY